MGREVAFVGETPKIVEYMPAEGFWLNVWQQLANSGCGVLHVTSIDNVLYIELAWWLKPPPDTIPQETTKRHIIMRVPRPLKINDNLEALIEAIF